MKPDAGDSVGLSDVIEENAKLRAENAELRAKLAEASRYAGFQYVCFTEEIMEGNTTEKPRLTPQMVETVEDILNRRRNSVELKVEQGKIKIIELKRQVIN